MYMIPASLDPLSYLAEGESARSVDGYRYPRYRQECCNLFQDFGVAHVGIVEAGSINEDDLSSVEDELVRDLDFGSA